MLMHIFIYSSGVYRVRVTGRRLEDMVWRVLILSVTRFSFIDKCIALLVTSSVNFVGRMKGPIQGSESSYWEGAFSLSKRLVEAM